MKRFFKIIVLLGFAVQAFSQNKKSSDTLSAVRNVFAVKVYQNSYLLDNKRQKLYFNENLIATKKNKTSTVLKVISPISLIAGGYLMYDGLKGKTFYTNVNGETVPYVSRSMKKLVGGVFLVVGSGVLFEYSKDLKIKAVNVYNNGVKNNNLTIKLGITPSGMPGFFAHLD